MQLKLGIIAGGGSLPRRVIDICRASGRDYYVIAIEGHALPQCLEDTPHSWIRIGTAGSGLNILKQENVKEIVMIGDVDMPSLKDLHPDLKTAKFFTKLGVQALGDNSLLTAATAELEAEGFKVIGVDEILDDLLAPEGVLGSVAAGDEFAEDIKLGIAAAQDLGRRDFGQAVIVNSGQIVAEENKAGTAEMIRRNHENSPNGQGGILVKIKKPGQDRRMDLPTIGVDTVVQAREVGLKGIIIQAGESIIVDLDDVVSTANAAGIFLRGVRLEEANATSVPKIYIIAGEPSGDNLGARLMAALKTQTAGEVRFTGVGGIEMTKQGLSSLFPMSDLTVMGLTEVLPRLLNLLRRINETVRHIRKTQPDVVVTIDTPDFSLRVAKKIHGHSIPLVHYVAPSVWAWKPDRAKKITPILDHLMTLLPFEPPYFEKEGLASTFVGHSILESGAAKGDGASFRSRFGIDPTVKVLSILPGSRHSEVKFLLPVIFEAIERLEHSNLRIILPTIITVEVELKRAIAKWPEDISRLVTIVTGEEAKIDAFAASDAAIAVSGTVALELALAGVPYVTIYKFNVLTAIIARRMVKTPFVNIINVLLDQEAVPELIQENCRGDTIAAHISKFLSDDDSAKIQVAKFEDAISRLQDGDHRPSERAAKVVLDVISQHVKLNK